MNHCILMGIICKGFENLTTQNGLKISKGTIGVKRNYKNSEGTYDTDFIKFFAYGNLSERMEKYVKEKDRIILIGEWCVRKYTLQDGKQVTSNELMVKDFQFLPKQTQEPQEQINKNYNESFGGQ